MAKTNRKHGRHKTRSPSAKAYAAEGRSLKNKLIKLRSHMKRNPTDKHNGANECLLKAGNKGKAPDYKPLRIPPEKVKEYLANKRWKLYLRGVV